MFTEHVQSRAGKREATRQKVLQSADRLFREQGFGATTIRQIAADAGVSSGSVMAVGDKEALLIAIFEGWIAERHRQDVESGAFRNSVDPSDPVEVVMLVFEPFVNFFDLDEELSREWGAIIMRGNHESAIFRGLEQWLMAAIAYVLVECGFGGEQAGHAAHAVYFAYLGVLMTVSNGARDREAGTAQLREIVKFVISHKGVGE